MGFWNRLLRGEDRTRDWIAQPEQTLGLDLDRGALCGVPLGDDADRLRDLGPAEDRRAARLGTYRYRSKGIEIDVEEGKTACYTLVWRDDDGEGFRPFAGVSRRRGSELRWSGETREAEITEHLGPPYWRAQDEDEILLFYEQDGVEWQLELNPEGLLRRILVLKPPLLADEEQRRAYRITKPWPPG